MLTLENGYLRVTVSNLGGELQSVYGRKTGIEYLWQGDETYWTGRAPNLFPFVGRLYKKKYTLNGKPYEIGLHGFVKISEMTVESEEKEYCVLLLRDNEETRKSYPYRFEFRVRYALEENRLMITYSVRNLSGETMIFGMGGHPGFNIPLVPGPAFEDYSLTFSESSAPVQVMFSSNRLISGEQTAFPLKDGTRLPLRHDLFDDDAVVLSGAPRCVTLSTPADPHGLRVRYPEMQYVGFWHKPCSDAPYVCIEPWTALPGTEGAVEELTEMPDRTRLAPGETCENSWSVEVW